MPLATLLVALLTARSSKLTGKPKSPLSDAARAEREAKRKGGTVILRANRTAPPSKFGQRLTMLRADPPSLLLLYHIEKTGGSSVFRWMQRQMKEPPRFTALFAYGQTACFFALHADLFPQMKPKWRASKCGGDDALMPDWRHSRVAVQFHSYSKGFFNDNVLPVMPQLRARYAALGGHVVATTVLREPSSYIFSKYMMWPPHDTTGHVMSLPDWLPQAEGFQRTSLLKAGPRAHTPGCEGLEQSRARLRVFDIVGVTSCLPLLLAALEQSVGLPRDPLRMANVYARPQGWGGKSGHEAHEHGWTMDKIKANASTRATLERVTRCDNHLYADILHRLSPRYLDYGNSTCTADSWLKLHPEF